MRRVDGETSGRLTWLVFLAVLALGLLVPAAAYSAYAYHFSGDNATAVFSSSNGSTWKMIYVSATDGQQRQTGVKKAASSYADVWLFVYDNAAGYVMDAQGYKEIAPADFVMANKLTQATLRGTIPVYDYVAGLNRSVMVKVDWKGIGPLYKNSYQYRYRWPGGMSTYRVRAHPATRRLPGPSRSTAGPSSRALPTTHS